MTKRKLKKAERKQREESEFEMRLLDVKSEMARIGRLVDSMKRAIEHSTPEGGLVIPIGVTSDIRGATHSIDGLVAYLRGRQDAVVGRGLVL